MSEPSSSSTTKRKRGLPSRVQMRHSNHFVDELAERNEPSVGRLVSLDQVEADPSQPRSDFDGLEELVQSVEDRGVLEPILVRPLGRSGGGPYRIISGERRFRAATEAGLLEIPVIVMEVSDREALEIALVENLQRKDLTPFEEADGYAALAEQYEYTHDQIAKAVGKSRTVVTESFSLLQLQPGARQTARDLRVLSKSILLEVLRRASEEEDQVELLERIAADGLNRADLRAEARVADAEDKATPKARKASDAPKPYVFKFKAPDKKYQLNITFRQESVAPTDLIEALESTIQQLRDLENEEQENLLSGPGTLG